MFGEGRHANMEQLYTTHLAPFLTQTSHAFWKTRLHYFKSGLYYQGGMVRYSPPSPPSKRRPFNKLNMQLVLIVELSSQFLIKSRGLEISRHNGTIQKPPLICLNHCNHSGSSSPPDSQQALTWPGCSVTGPGGVGGADHSAGAGHGSQHPADCECQYAG